MSDTAAGSRRRSDGLNPHKSRSRFRRKKKNTHLRQRPRRFGSCYHSLMKVSESLCWGKERRHWTGHVQHSSEYSTPARIYPAVLQAEVHLATVMFAAGTLPMA